MLSHLQIRDFALIKLVELEFDRGMTALTGETGAGKSILLDAIGLVLGDRLHRGGVREGARQAEITACFDISEAGLARAWLDQQGLVDDEGAECCLRRVIAAHGRSRGFINGRPATMAQLGELGELLVDIHGQNSHQSLGRSEVQRQLLDDFGGHVEATRAVAEAAGRWQRLADERERLRALAHDDAIATEHLAAEVERLERVVDAAQAFEALEREHRRLSNSAELLATTQGVVDELSDGEDPLDTRLARAIARLRQMVQIDGQLAPVIELLDSAEIQLQEAADGLRGYAQHLDPGSERLVEVERVMSDIHALGRRHRVEPSQLPEVLATLRGRAEELADIDERLQAVERELAEAERAYAQAAATLSAARRTAGTRLSDLVSRSMRALGMAGGVFEVALESLAEQRPRATGAEMPRFCVATNPGMAPQSLGRVASGGELARISLAIQMIVADQGRIPTLIFDEVDSGIGGGVAEMVGKTLRRLGHTRQTLCVTHLAQVAAQANRQYQVSKVAKAGGHVTVVTELDEADRVNEIARMLGGMEVTEQSHAHAREMLDRAGTEAALDAPHGNA